MNKSDSSISYPPGPKQKLPLFLFLNFLRNPIGVLVDISKYGDISHFKFGTQHVYFLNHPDYIRDVLVTYNNSFIKSRGLQVAKKVLGDLLSLNNRRVFTESMRLYSPAWAVGRQAIHDCKIGEYTIPAGSTVLMSQYLMHRDPRFFPNLKDSILIAGIVRPEQICRDLVTFHLVVALGHVLESHLHGPRVY